MPPYNGQRPKSATCLANRSFLHGLLPPAHLFCSVLEMCRRGGMLRPFPCWAGRTHEITHYLSAILNAIALLFKNHFIIIEFSIMRAQTICASTCRRTGEYLVFIVELPFFCNVYFVAALKLRGKCILDVSSSACTAVTEAVK